LVIVSLYMEIPETKRAWQSGASCDAHAQGQGSYFTTWTFVTKTDPVA